MKQKCLWNNYQFNYAQMSQDLDGNSCLLTYIIPFYDGERCIVNCLESIFALNLSEQELEVIVVDDCSPIDAISVLGNYCKRHSNLRIIRHDKNKRQGGAKNTGIRNSRGLYVAFADQDDEILPNHVDAAIRMAVMQSPDVLSCRWIAESDGNDYETGVQLKDGTMMGGVTFCEEVVDPGVSFGPWSYLYRRDFLWSQAHPMAEHVIMEDADWIAWHLFFAKSVLFFNRAIYRWHIYHNSLSHSPTSYTRIAWIKLGLRILDDSNVYKLTSARYSEKMYQNGVGDIERQFNDLWKVKDCHRFFQLLSNEGLLDRLRVLKLSNKTRKLIKHPKSAKWSYGIYGLLRRTFEVTKRFMLGKKKAVSRRYRRVKSIWINNCNRK